MRELSEAEREEMRYINGRIGLQSMLWDMDLMPEQLEVGGERWGRMLEVVREHRELGECNQS